MTLWWSIFPSLRSRRFAIEPFNLMHHLKRRRSRGTRQLLHHALKSGNGEAQDEWKQMKSERLMAWGTNWTRLTYDGLTTAMICLDWRSLPGCDSDYRPHRHSQKSTQSVRRAKRNRLHCESMTGHSVKPKHIYQTESSKMVWLFAT